MKRHQLTADILPPAFALNLNLATAKVSLQFAYLSYGIVTELLNRSPPRHGVC